MRLRLRSTIVALDALAAIACGPGTPKFMAAAEFTRFQRDEMTKWGEAVRYSGAKQD